MPQVTIPNGCLMGMPGAQPGTAMCYAFCDVGDPNSRSDPQGLLGNSALGSTYQRLDAPDSTHAFYTKTAQPNGSTSTVNGTWTNK